MSKNKNKGNANTTANKILWIGGTSSLTRTFVHCQLLDPQRLVLVGLETSPPHWIPFKASYVSCDLTTVTDSQAMDLLSEYVQDITTIIIGVRPLLFAPYTNTDGPHKMLQGIQRLLQAVIASGPGSNLPFVLHISSVAAMDHLRTQQFLSEVEPFPPLDEYQAPYDKFKRHCEEEITQACQSQQSSLDNSVPSVCHLRLSAIFSDDDSCIQCSALQLQSRLGCYLPLPIDCNSSVNVSRAIWSILEQSTQDVTKIQPIYYYTRPLVLPKPVPYGYYLQEYRKAHQLEHASIWIPVWIVTWFTAIFHWISSWNVYLKLPYVDAGDYLLQVAAREHSFDCTKFAQDFPDFNEETILECFVRRKGIQTGTKKVNQPSSGTPKRD